jgi:hypothetical protein
LGVGTGKGFHIPPKLSRRRVCFSGSAALWMSDNLPSSEGDGVGVVDV